MTVNPALNVQQQPNPSQQAQIPQTPTALPQTSKPKVAPQNPLIHQHSYITPHPHQAAYQKNQLVQNIAVSSQIAPTNIENNPQAQFKPTIDAETLKKLDKAVNAGSQLRPQEESKGEVKIAKSTTNTPKVSEIPKNVTNQTKTQGPDAENPKPETDQPNPTGANAEKIIEMAKKLITPESGSTSPPLGSITGSGSRKNFQNLKHSELTGEGKGQQKKNVDPQENKGKRLKKEKTKTERK
jgi:hypothetical protein